MDMRDIKEFLKDAFKYIVIIVIVLFIVIYIVTLQQVVGPSMSPTLNNGDVLLLDKVSYRFKEIERYDVVALNYADTKYLIKRIIGLPGETIEYKNNILYINGEAFQETGIENLITEDFSLKDIGYEVIPDDMYLVLGDNRGNSLDSRDIGLKNLAFKSNKNSKIVLKTNKNNEYSIKKVAKAINLCYIFFRKDVF